MRSPTAVAGTEVLRVAVVRREPVEPMEETAVPAMAAQEVPAAPVRAPAVLSVRLASVVATVAAAVRVLELRQVAVVAVVAELETPSPQKVAAAAALVVKEAMADSETRATLETPASTATASLYREVLAATVGSAVV